jgi:hypothetical protein
MYTAAPRIECCCNSLSTELVMQARSHRSAFLRAARGYALVQDETELVMQTRWRLTHREARALSACRQSYAPIKDETELVMQTRR